MRYSPSALSRYVEIGRSEATSECFLTSDSFFEWAPSGPEMLRMLIGALLEVGVKEDEIVEMVQGNPRTLLNAV